MQLIIPQFKRYIVRSPKDGQFFFGILLNVWKRCLDHITNPYPINTLRPRQNGRHFADDIFKCIFLNENVLIPIKISLKYVPKGPNNNIPALFQIMAWRRLGGKPLSEQYMRRPTSMS